MDTTAQREEKRRIAERAAEWLIALEDGGADERAAFAEWVSASPQHLKEFLLMSALEGEIGRIDPERKMEVEKILSAAAGNVVMLKGQDAPSLTLPRRPGEGIPPPPLRSGGGLGWGQWTSIGVTAAFVAIMGWWIVTPGGQTYETAIGEQRRVQLSDGSTVQMNAKSWVRVEFNDKRRDIRLLDGEALFKVERDPARPFRVHSDTSVIQALGTQFNVLRRPSGTVVSVIEGAVRVSTAEKQASQPMLDRLTAGEEMRIDRRGQVQQKKKQETAAMAAWRSDRLVFRDDTLEDIAAQFNRYNRNTQIRLQDDHVRTRRYTAVFDANDPQSLIEFLREDAGLSVEARESEVLVTAPTGRTGP